MHIINLKTLVNVTLMCKMLYQRNLYKCSARTTNVSFLYYFTVIRSDRHFHLYSCRNQEGSQLFVIHNLVIIQQSYTT